MITYFQFFHVAIENDRRSGEFSEQAWEAILISSISPEGRDLIGNCFTILKRDPIGRQLSVHHHHQQGRTPKVIALTHASHPISPDAESSHLLYLKTSELRSFVFSGFVLIITMICNRQSTQRGREKRYPCISLLPSQRYSVK